MLSPDEARFRQQVSLDDASCVHDCKMVHTCTECNVTQRQLPVPHEGADNIIAVQYPDILT